MAQSIELKDFSGGITDYYLYAPPNKLKQCDNLLINHYQGMGKPFNRPGSELFDSTSPQISTASRINTCFKYKGLLFVQSGAKIFYYNPSVVGDKWVQLKNPDNNDPLAASNTIYYSYSLWNNHILITGSPSNTTSISGFVQKIVIENGVPTIFNAGLLTPINFDVNSLTISKASGSNTYLYKFVYRQNYNAGGAEFEDISEPSRIIKVENCATISKDSTVVISGIPCIQPGNGYRTDIKIDVYRTTNNQTTFYYVGSVRNTGSTAQFVDDLQDTLPVGGYSVYENLAAFPVTGVVNNVYFAKDTSKYYKWRFVSGVGFYQEIVDFVQSGVLLIPKESRITADVNQTLYTTGGVIENGMVPFCRTLHIKNDTAYYGNIFDPSGNETLNFRLYQSVVGDIDAVPATFYVDVDDEIISVSSTKSNVIVLCRNSAYRVDGGFDELGRGGMIVERISDTAGCISVQCVVQALDGVFWLGQDGAYYTDGFKVIKLNEDHDQRYKSFVSPAEYSLPEGGTTSRVQKIQGKYDKKKNRIWWIMQSDTDSLDTDMCYVLDLNWGVQPNATFTTVSGNTLYPSAIEFDDGDMIRCHKNGYVLVHRAGLYSDPKINPDVPVSTWSRETIIYTLETVAFDFGTSATRKFVTQVNVTCESDETNLSLQLISNNDDGRRIANLLPIRYRGVITWGEPDIYWGDPKLDWNKRGLIHEKRLFPAKSLRCNFKSIAMTNAQVAIVSSDLLDPANVNSFLKQVELVDYVWPSDSVGYYIAFEDDNYETEYEIVARTDDIITYADPLNTSISGLNKKWVVRGKPKGEILNLLNLSAVYEMSGPTMNPFRKSDSGEVGS